MATPNQCWGHVSSGHARVKFHWHSDSKQSKIVISSLHFHSDKSRCCPPEKTTTVWDVCRHTPKRDKENTAKEWNVKWLKEGLHLLLWWQAISLGESAHSSDWSNNSYLFLQSPKWEGVFKVAELCKQTTDRRSDKYETGRKSASVVTVWGNPFLL